MGEGRRPLAARAYDQRRTSYAQVLRYRARLGGRGRRPRSESRVVATSPSTGCVAMTLLRLVLDYRGDDLVVRCLYRSDGRSNPGTKARAREVTDLARSGLRDALEALEGGAEVVGTSGFTQRE